MSGPVDEQSGETRDLGMSSIEVKGGRTARIGDLTVLRVLPTKQKRTIGPWCFVDLMSPDDVESPPPMEIGPHPHIGLSTVTWLFTGSALHSDSLGTEQLISPGQLNLMTTGHGLAHAELGVETTPAHATNGVMGVQMWLAQPETTRHGSARFEHLEEVPEITFPGGRGQLMIGQMETNRSAARIDHPAIGVDITVEKQALLPTDPSFEYALVPIDVPLKINEAIVEPGALAYVPPGFAELRLETRSSSARVMFLGGLPLGEEVKMWWNFVARTQEEITQAWRDWQERNDERFGRVPSALRRIEAPTPPWVRG